MTFYPSKWHAIQAEQRTPDTPKPPATPLETRAELVERVTADLLLAIGFAVEPGTPMGPDSPIGKALLAYRAALTPDTPKPPAFMLDSAKPMVIDRLRERLAGHNPEQSPWVLVLARDLRSLLEPAPVPASAETLEQFIATQLARVENAIRSRREEATVWRDTDEETHEASRVLAERMGGRKLPRHTRTQREELARTQDRICLKLEAEAESYRQVADALRRLQSTEQEPSWAELNAHYAKALSLINTLRERAEAAEQKVRDLEHEKATRCRNCGHALSECQAHKASGKVACCPECDHRPEGEKKS